MAYLHINKENNKYRLFSSIKKLSNALKIPVDNLYTVFSRKKLKEYENNEYKILKVKVE